MRTVEHWTLARFLLCLISWHTNSAQTNERLALCQYKSRGFSRYLLLEQKFSKHLDISSLLPQVLLHFCLSCKYVVTGWSVSYFVSREPVWLCRQLDTVRSSWSVWKQQPLQPHYMGKTYQEDWLIWRLSYVASVCMTIDLHSIRAPEGALESFWL